MLRFVSQTLVKDYIACLLVFQQDSSPPRHLMMKQLFGAIIAQWRALPRHNWW